MSTICHESPPLGLWDCRPCPSPGVVCRVLGAHPWAAGEDRLQVLCGVFIVSICLSPVTSPETSGHCCLPFLFSSMGIRLGKLRMLNLSFLPVPAAVLPLPPKHVLSSAENLLLPVSPCPGPCPCCRTGSDVKLWLVIHYGFDQRVL